MTDFTPSPVRFALWDKEHSLLIAPDDIGDDFAITNSTVLVDAGSGRYVDVGGFYEILPSTGLPAKTKDGTEREIVEGDIVRVGMGVNGEFFIVKQQDLKWMLSPLNPKRARQEVLEGYIVRGSFFDFTILCHALSDEAKAMMNADKKGRET